MTPFQSDQYSTSRYITFACAQPLCRCAPSGYWAQHHTNIILVSYCTQSERSSDRTHNLYGIETHSLTHSHASRVCLQCTYAVCVHATCNGFGCACWRWENEMSNRTVCVKWKREIFQVQVDAHVVTSHRSVGRSVVWYGWCMACKWFLFSPRHRFRRQTGIHNEWLMKKSGMRSICGKGQKTKLINDLRRGRKSYSISLPVDRVFIMTWLRYGPMGIVIQYKKLIWEQFFSSPRILACVSACGWVFDWIASMHRRPRAASFIFHSNHAQSVAHVFYLHMILSFRATLCAVFFFLAHFFFCFGCVHFTLNATIKKILFMLCNIDTFTLNAKTFHFISVFLFRCLFISMYTVSNAHNYRKNKSNFAVYLFEIFLSSCVNSKNSSMRTDTHVGRRTYQESDRRRLDVERFERSAYSQPASDQARVREWM